MSEDTFTIGVRLVLKIILLLSSGMAFFGFIHACFGFIYNRVKHGSVWGEDKAGKPKLTYKDD